MSKRQQRGYLKRRRPACKLKNEVKCKVVLNPKAVLLHIVWDLSVNVDRCFRLNETIRVKHAEEFILRLRWYNRWKMAFGKQANLLIKSDHFCEARFKENSPIMHQHVCFKWSDCGKTRTLIVYFESILELRSSKCSVPVIKSKSHNIIVTILLFYWMNSKFAGVSIPTCSFITLLNQSSNSKNA